MAGQAAMTATKIVAKSVARHCAPITDYAERLLAPSCDAAVMPGDTKDPLKLIRHLIGDGLQRNLLVSI